MGTGNLGLQGAINHRRVSTGHAAQNILDVHGSSKSRRIAGADIELIKTVKQIRATNGATRNCMHRAVLAHGGI